MGFALLAGASAAGGASDFTVVRKGPAGPGRTLLVVGGIQGDEPGGFNAAALLATRYTISRGRLWIVPNLNFPSILARARGLHGDMNRKFANLAPDDPDYAAVEKVKGLIQAPRVDVVLNLHDGSGYYRHRHMDRLHSPRRWGQSVIVDQDYARNATVPHLAADARYVAGSVNGRLLHPEHGFRVKNTRTAEGNREMAKTLTYYAIRHGKAAYGLEATKDLRTHQRAYYHLLALEAFMRLHGIRYDRDFPLTPEGVRHAIRSNLRTRLFGRRFVIPLDDVRERLNYVPVKADGPLRYEASNPLIAVRPHGDGFRVHYGNRRLTTLYPQYFEYADALGPIALTVDGRREVVESGSRVAVQEAFRVESMPGIRTNVIGWRGGGGGDESGYTVRREEIPERFSVDTSGRIYRIEFYRKGRFAGMVLVDFGSPPDRPINQAFDDRIPNRTRDTVTGR